MSRLYRNPWPRIAKSDQGWRNSLEKRSKLAIEIGSGQGLFAIRYAQENPDTLFLAFERTQTKYAKLAGRLEHHRDLQNLLAFPNDAVPWLSQRIEEAEVDAYYCLYPNPYPKASQKNRRLAHMPFLHFMQKSLKSGGTITLATNLPDYFQEAKNLIPETCQKLRLEVAKELPKDYKARTHFEKKYLARGQTCYQLIFCKI